MIFNGRSHMPALCSVDFKKNEKKYDGNMSEVLRMVQDMDKNPQAHTEPTEDMVDSAPLDPDYSGLNSIKSRSMRSLVVRREYERLRGRIIDGALLAFLSIFSNESKRLI